MLRDSANESRIGRKLDGTDAIRFRRFVVPAEILRINRINQKDFPLWNEHSSSARSLLLSVNSSIRKFFFEAGSIGFASWPKPPSSSSEIVQETRSVWPNPN